MAIIDTGFSVVKKDDGTALAIPKASPQPSVLHFKGITPAFVAQSLTGPGGEVLSGIELDFSAIGALLAEFPGVVASGTFSIADFVDGGTITFDLSGAGGLVVATSNNNGAPTISADGYEHGRVYTVAFLDLPGATVAWDSMFVIVGGEDNSTSGGPNELLITRWQCLTLPGFGTKLYQLTGKTYVL